MAKQKTTYTEEQKAAALAEAEKVGIHAAAKSVGIPWQRIASWVRETKPAVKEKVEAATADVKVKAGTAKKKVDAAAADMKKKTAARKAKLAVVIQSPFGGEITPDEIAAKIPKEASEVYVRVDENKLYWVSKDQSGAVDIW